MHLIDLTDRYNIARAPLDQARVDGGAWHHTYTATPTRDWTVYQEIGALDAFDRYHREPHWFTWDGRKVSLGGFAYHLAVFPSGRVYLTTPLAMRGAHVASHNGHLVAVVLIGNFSRVAPAPLHLVAARAAGHWVESGLSLSLEWKGHRDWADPQYATACPGDTHNEWVPGLSAKEDDDMLVEVIRGPDGTQIVTNRIHRWGIATPELKRELEALGWLKPGVTDVSQELLNSLRDTHQPFPSA